MGTKANQSTVFRDRLRELPQQRDVQVLARRLVPGGRRACPWDIDVTSQSRPPRLRQKFTYGVDAYLNTCNADAQDGGLCTGCASGESCAYDGSDHTQPFFYISSPS